MEHKGTYNRGYLPHRDYPGATQAITLRLADSIPKQVLNKWKAELSSALNSPDHVLVDEANEELRRQISKYEDLGFGDCLLADPHSARVLQDLLLNGNPDSYQLIAWCIMPNHAHVLIRQTNVPMCEFVRIWKGSSAIEINRLHERSGKLWEREYFDRAIRDESHFYRSVKYIHHNPVKAGLCKEPEDWTFSSLGTGWNPEEAG